MALKIAFDNDVPGDLKAAAPGWLQETIDWLLQQEQPPKPRDPLYEVKTYRIGLLGWAKGLQNRRTGQGWDYLQMTQILSVMTRPTYQRFDVGFETAFKGNNIFLLSQSRGTPSYEDDDFAWSFHESLQRKWIQEFLPDVAAAVRLKRLKEQQAQKHKLQLERQRLSRQPRTPQRYKPHYGEPPAFVPAPIPSPAKEHPVPVLSPQDAAALEIIANQQAYMASFCSTEDHDM